MAEKMKVKGIAIKAGKSRNGIIYTSEELKKFAKTMEGRPIQKDHDTSVDKSIGLIEKAKYDSVNESVTYEGWITEDGTGILPKVSDKRIKEVSIGAICGKLVKENDDSNFMMAKDMTCMELSVVSTPGIIGTSISQALTANQSAKSISEKLSAKRFSEFTATIEKYEVQPMQSIVEKTEKAVAQVEESLKKDDIKNIKENSKEETKMTDEKIVESEVTKLKETLTSKETEASSLKEQLAIMQKDLQEKAGKLELVEKQRKDSLVAEYNVLAKEKAKDVSKLSEDAIKTLIETLREAIVVVAPVKESGLKGVSVMETSTKETKNKLEGVVVERAESGNGFSLYVSEFKPSLKRLVR